MDTSVISKHRTELMGFAILEVLAGHLFSLGGLNAPSLIGKFASLFFVQGFLLVSGMSMFYSYTKDHHLISFYKKRFRSLMIPFLVMVIPCYGLIYLMGAQDAIPFYSSVGCQIQNPFLSFLGKITTLSYWVEGNYNGMWYVALTVFLYAIFPVVYWFVFDLKIDTRQKSINGGGKIILSLVLVIIVCVLFYGFMRKYCPQTALIWKHALINLPFFFVGVLIGWMSYNRKAFDIQYLLIVSSLYFILDNTFICLMTLPLVCYALEYLPENGYLRKLLGIFGSYTLEIYVLHLTIFSIIEIFEMENAFEMPYLYKISLTLAFTFPLAVLTKRITQIINKYI